MMLVVRIHLEKVNETVVWLVSPDKVSEVERAVQAGEIGAARIVKVDPVRRGTSALRRTLALPSIEVAR